MDEISRYINNDLINNNVPIKRWYNIKSYFFTKFQPTMVVFTFLFLIITDYVSESVKSISSDFFYEFWVIFKYVALVLYIILLTRAMVWKKGLDRLNIQNDIITNSLNTVWYDMYCKFISQIAIKSLMVLNFIFVAALLI